MRIAIFEYGPKKRDCPRDFRNPQLRFKNTGGYGPELPKRQDKGLRYNAATASPLPVRSVNCKVFTRYADSFFKGTTSRQSLIFIEKSKRSSQFKNNQDGRFDVRNNQDGRFASLLIKTVVSIILIIKTVVRTNSFNQDGRKRSKIIKMVVLQY